MYIICIYMYNKIKLKLTEEIVLLTIAQVSHI